MRLKPIFGVLPVALAIALGACGGDSDDKASGEKTAASDPAAAEKLLEETFGPNPKAKSGLLNGKIEIDTEGVPALKEPTSIGLSGPFSQSGSGPPEANLSASLRFKGRALGGDLILAGDGVLIGLGTTAYQVPASIAKPIRKPLVNSDNALGSVLAVFGITPRTWAKDPRIVGEEQLDGEDVIHVTAELDSKQMFRDLSRLVRVLTSLRITEVTGLPRVIGEKERAALQRSVKSAKGDVFTGAQDKVMRKAAFRMTFEMSAKDRRILGGIKSMKADGELLVTEVGSEQDVSPPRNRGDFSALQVALDALADSVK